MALFTPWHSHELELLRMQMTAVQSSLEERIKQGLQGLATETALQGLVTETSFNTGLQGLATEATLDSRLRIQTQQLLMKMSEMLSGISHTAVQPQTHGGDIVQNNTLLAVMREAIDTLLRQAANEGVDMILALLSAAGEEGKLNRERASMLKVNMFGAYRCHILTVLLLKVKTREELLALLSHKWLGLGIMDVRVLLACAKRFSMECDTAVRAVLDAQDAEFVRAARDDSHV
ncbi:hypothetical protein JKP88DRAFT_243951 [Tribonema minus]|uniref:Uncharacterized protein n=1 Tax=Tribonema minus TaxID=303371 RepID=A0A835Z642_9STRA|nr:hypothetical protein JKP88DRAFT_243951 [Tribonema minus]